MHLGVLVCQATGLSAAPVPRWKMHEFPMSGQRSRDQGQPKAASFYPKKSVLPSGPEKYKDVVQTQLILSENAVLETWWGKHLSPSLLSDLT